MLLCQCDTIQLCYNVGYCVPVLRDERTITVNPSNLHEKCQQDNRKRNTYKGKIGQTFSIYQALIAAKNKFLTFNYILNHKQI